MDLRFVSEQVCPRLTLLSTTYKISSTYITQDLPVQSPHISQNSPEKHVCEPEEVLIKGLTLMIMEVDNIKACRMGGRLALGTCLL